MRPRVREALIVEGRYDKNTVSQVVDTVIIETSGFSVFKNSETLALIRRLAETRGVIILTDSDGAGFLIRGHLNGKLPQNGVKHAYIPDIFGKERRKRNPSSEGTLGVEGMRPEVILEALHRAGATFEGEEAPEKTLEITSVMLYELGLSGTKNSASRREALLKFLDLPAHMGKNAMLDVLNALFSREELEAALKTLEKE